MDKNILLKLKTITPDPIWNLAKTVRDKLRKLNSGYPIVQMYLNTDEVETFLGINDFYSFLVPEVKSPITIHFQFFNKNGSRIFSISKTYLPGSDFKISVKELFLKNTIKSEMGIVTLSIAPKHARNPSYKRMGVAGSHFYVFYHHHSGPSNGSVGHVHPSSTLDPNNSISGDFISNQSIICSELNGIALLQANPSSHSVSITHSVIDIVTKDVICSKKSILEPFSTNLIEFGFEESTFKQKRVTIMISPLPTSNSKPLLIRKSKKNLWSYSHS
jgi:hypothetical protein